MDAEDRAPRKSVRLEGTCFGRRPRLVGFDGIALDAPLEGQLLMTRHHDRPGQIGRIGTLLGRHRVNLKSVDVGSLTSSTAGDAPSRAPLAVGIFGIDSVLPTAALAELATVDGVVELLAVLLPSSP